MFDQLYTELVVPFEPCEERLEYLSSRNVDVQAGFRKGRGTRDQIANIYWSLKSKRIPEKHLLIFY